MATYNVRCRFNKDASYDYERYNATIELPNLTGNTVEGKFTKQWYQGTTAQEEIVLYWNYMEMIAQVTQGTTMNEAKYYSSGKYYPNRTYSCDIDMSTIPFIATDTYRITVWDKQKMFAPNTSSFGSGFIALDLTRVVAEQPFEISKSGDYIYQPITFKWKQTSVNKVEIICLDGDKEVYKVTDFSATSVTIPAGTFHSTNVSFKIRSYFKIEGTTFYSSWVTYRATGLQALTAETPSNVRIVGVQRAIEENLSFAWDTTEALCRATVEIWQDGNKVTEQSNISNKQYVLNAGTLNSTSAIRIRVKNTISINGYTHTSTYAEVTVSDLTSIKPIIESLALSALNADYSIQATITATNAQNYEIYKGAVKIASSETNTLIIPPGALSKGTNTLKVVATRTSSAGLLKSELTKSFSIVHDEPLIYAVEPSKINVNIDELSKVSFSTNNFIDRWELFINGSLFITGTTEREVQISGGIFRAGTNTLKVTAYYSPAHDSSQIRTFTKEVTFTGFGKPSGPVLDFTTVYETATPTFTWTTGESENDTQVAFEIEVHTENKIVNSADKSYTMTTALLDQQNYTVRLRIKNKYEIWSSWVEKEFKTVFSELPKPIITLSPQKENVLIVVECIEIQTFNSMVIYRSADKVNWIEIANDLNLNDNLIDYMVAGGVETFYKARIYDSVGGYNESEIKSVESRLINYNLLSVQELKSNKQLDFVAINFKNNFTSITKLFAGAAKPIFYKGKGNYLTANMTVKLVNDEVNNFVDYLNKGEIFCYRDYKGKKLFVAVDLTAVNYINPFMQEVVLNLTEVNFNEYHYANKHQGTTIVYLDGSYCLDGSINMSGLGASL